MRSQCANPRCDQTFEITDDDVAFYDKISPIFGGKKYPIPPPTRCPECRRQRKLSWRNDRKIYERTCDLCSKDMVSVHAADHPYPVYCNSCWWSDRWDPLSFGRDYDLLRPFFEQYKELYNLVPQRGMVNDDGVKSVNCAYTFDVPFSKNCYMCSGMWKAEDCLYCRICDQSKFCTDCEGVVLESELVYDSVDSQHLYSCAYLQNSENCRNCIFGFDLKGCSDCLACSGLRHQQYHVFNKPYSEDEYQRLLASYMLHSHSGVQKLKEEFTAFILRTSRKNLNLQNCEDCLGDHLFNCRNIYYGHVCHNSEHSKWIERSDGPLHSYDIIQSGKPQWCLECITVDDGFMDLACMYCNQTRNTYYSDNCLSSDMLLGCISLRRKKHCIFNKQYSEEEYGRLAGSIIESMQQHGEWGEFFPVTNSPFGYNETNGAEFYPLSKSEIEERGWQWREIVDEIPQVERIIPASRLPDSIRDIPDDILNWAIECEATKRPYRIVKKELDFYRTMEIPIPRFHPDERFKKRMERRNPYRFWKRPCAKCGKEMKTTYAPDRPEAVYCEECYLKEMY